MKLLSIIVPIYNAEKYLVTCLDSLVNQTYDPKEIILVDDGSNDSSSEICDNYKKRYPFVHVIHQKNAGVMAARNAGLDIANGDYIALCDSDDAVDIDMYQILIEALEKTRTDVASCGWVDEYSGIRAVRNNSIPRAKVFNNNSDVLIGMFYDYSGFVWNKIFKRQLIEGQRFRNDVVITDDLQFTWDALKKANSLCYIDLPMYHYRYIFSSATKSSNIKKQIKALNAWNNIKQDVDKLGLTQKVISKWAQSYIVWNIKICEKMLFWKEPDIKVYYLVKNNISKYKEYIGLLGRRHRILANSLLRSWPRYRIWGKSFYYLKKNYINIRSIKRKTQ